MSLFRMSGPEFLSLYLQLLFAAGLWALAVLVVCRTYHTAAPSGTSGRRELGATELALISGAPYRLVEVALAALAREGKLRPGLEGKLDAVGSVVGLNPVHAKVLVSIKAGKRSLRDINRALVVPPRLQEALAHEGLLPALDSPYMRCRRVMALPLGVLLLLGLARLGVGLAHGRPVLYLALLLIVSAVSFVILYFRKPARTPVGRQHFDTLAKKNAALKVAATTRPESLSSADFATAVALFGLAVMAHGEMAWLHEAAVPKGDGGGGCGSSCGSSSGDGGGGGSGCGGCGGGCG